MKSRSLSLSGGRENRQWYMVLTRINGVDGKGQSPDSKLSIRFILQQILLSRKRVACHLLWQPSSQIELEMAGTLVATSPWPK